MPVPSKSGELKWLLLLLIAVAAVRLIALGADPLLDTDPTFIYDWGEWAKNARLHALFGVWMVDDHNAGLYLATWYTLVLRLVFAALGSGRPRSTSSAP